MQISHREDELNQKDKLIKTLNQTIIEKILLNDEI
jgi:hypothetical protein